MTVLTSTVDTSAPSFVDNAAAMHARLGELDEALAAAVAGGGPRYTERHHARGKLLPRERIELLLDRDAPFLELCPVAGCCFPACLERTPAGNRGRTWSRSDHRRDRDRGRVAISSGSHSGDTC